MTMPAGSAVTVHVTGPITVTGAPPATPPPGAPPATPPESGADVLRTIAYGICTGAIVSQLLAKARLKISVPVSLVLLAPVAMYAQLGLRRTNDLLGTAAKTAGTFLWTHRKPVSIFLGISAAVLFLKNMANQGKIAFTQSNAGIVFSRPEKSS